LTPLDVLPPWTDVAQRAGVILAAPKSIAVYGWRIREDSPVLLRDIVDDIATRRPVDRRRLYLFGYSSGAAHALTLGLLESQYFAAVAVYAGAFRERGSFKLIPVAKRRIPLWITIGDRDQFFVMKDVTATEAALRDGGFPLVLTIIKGRSARDQGPRTSALSKPTPQKGQKAIRRPMRYWLAIWIPRRSRQVGHRVRSRYNSAPSMTATPRTPAANAT
jgi:dienelactone hydrolase